MSAQAMEDEVFTGKMDFALWRKVVRFAVPHRRKIYALLALGALVCGFFWEMWNYYSFPKWTYHTPGAEFLKIFEMPLLGYGGDIPFALELYALKILVWPGGPAPALEPMTNGE